MFQEMAMLVEQQDEVIVNVENQAQGVDHDISAGWVGEICPWVMLKPVWTRRIGPSTAREGREGRSGSASGSAVSAHVE